MRAPRLLEAQMTQDEKLRLVLGFFGVKGGSIFSRARRPNTRRASQHGGIHSGIPRLGIPSLVESVCGLGIANSANTPAGDEATALPSGLAMARDWKIRISSFRAGSGARTRRRATAAYSVVLAAR